MVSVNRTSGEEGRAGLAPLAGPSEERCESRQGYAHHHAGALGTSPSWQRVTGAHALTARSDR